LHKNTRKTELRTTIQQETREYIEGAGKQVYSSNEWLRAGAGNETIKETEETKETQNRVLHSLPFKK